MHMHKCLWLHVQLCLFYVNHWRVFMHGWWNTERADGTGAARVGGTDSGFMYICVCVCAVFVSA